MQFTEAIRQFEGQPITRQILLGLLQDYKRPLDRITDLIRQGILTQVKAKIYVPGPNLKMRGPEPLLLANHLAGPSYVSMETALSYWRLIPEKVFEISSVITGRTRVYSTPVGRFSYIHLPLPYFSFGQVSAVLAAEQTAMMATAEKALCDKIITTAGLLLYSPKQAKAWLLEDMRMDRDKLRLLKTKQIQEWLSDAPKKQSLESLIKALEDL